MISEVKKIDFSYQVQFNMNRAQVSSSYQREPTPSIHRNPVLEQNDYQRDFLTADSAVVNVMSTATAPSGVTAAGQWASTDLIGTMPSADSAEAIAPANALSSTVSLSAASPQIAANLISGVPEAASGNQTQTDPGQIVRNTPTDNAVLRPASPLAAQTETISPLAESQQSSPFSNTIPEADANPDIAVNNVSKYMYNVAMRAYQPDNASFLQPQGYETSQFTRAEYFNNPASAQTADSDNITETDGVSAAVPAVEAAQAPDILSQPIQEAGEVDEASLEEKLQSAMYKETRSEQLMSHLMRQAMFIYNTVSGAQTPLGSSLDVYF